MHYVTREFVCERLKVSLWASYKFAPATSIRRIQSDSVIAVLNRSRKAREKEIDFIPSDIVTPDEASEETGIPAKTLVTWTRRAVKAPPHYRLNKQTTRFRLSSLNEWLERRANGQRG